MKGEEDVGDTVRTEPCPHRKKKEREKEKEDRETKKAQSFPSANIPLGIH